MTEPRRPYWLVLAFVGMLMLPPGLSIALAVGAGVLRTAVSIGRWATHRRAAARAARSEERHGIALGVTAEGRPLGLSDAQLAAHGLILGASGSGKSTTLLRILTEHIHRGTPVVAIDLKGSPQFARTLADAARAAGRPFRLWTPDGPSHWNLLAHGNPTELKDKLIGSERFTEPHYQKAAERYLQTVLQVLEHTRGGQPPTLEHVVGLMDPRRLGVALRHVPRPLAVRVQDYLAELTPDQLSAVRGLATRLAIVTESHTGRYLNPGDAQSTIDLRSALNGPEVVLFSLHASRYGQLAAQLGTMVVQDLITATGPRLSGAPEQAVVAIDEFSALGADHLGGMVARARESRVAVLLVTQEFADLNRAAPGLRDQVIGNTTVKIVHRQDVPDSAWLVARMAGTRRVWETTYQVSRGWLGGGFGATGRGTRREAERFVIEPSRIASLRAGEAVVIAKAPTTSVRIAWVTPPRAVPAGGRAVAPGGLGGVGPGGGGSPAPAGRSGPPRWPGLRITRAGGPVRGGSPGPGRTGSSAPGGPGRRAPGGPGRRAPGGTGRRAPAEARHRTPRAETRAAIWTEFCAWCDIRPLATGQFHGRHNRGADCDARPRGGADCRSRHTGGWGAGGGDARRQRGDGSGDTARTRQRQPARTGAAARARAPQAAPGVTR